MARTEIRDYREIIDLRVGDIARLKDEKWAADVNADEAGCLLAESEEHIRALLEILEDGRLRSLFGHAMSAQKHRDHTNECEPCQSTRLRYARLRAEARAAVAKHAPTAPSPDGGA